MAEHFLFSMRRCATDGRIDRVRPLTPTPMCATDWFNWDIRLSLYFAVVGDGLHA